MKIIKPETLQIGQKLTISKWVSHKDYSWCGDILEIREIYLPYVVVNILSGFKAEDISLDVRHVEFGEVSEEYINFLTKSSTV